ncbi:MAG TPA: hypothetical protein VFB43_15895 [Terracidiphilus sp.]|nr:hypothetical protein [Terracidiphilus sp.]
MRAALLVLGLLACSAHTISAQSGGQGALAEKVQKLTDAIAHTQSQLDESQRQLDELRHQLTAVQQELARTGGNASTASTPETAQSAPPAVSAQPSDESKSTDVAEVQEKQEFETSQIATLDQEKVESESKFPVKITGLLLLNSFVNTGAVDIAATPTVAIPGGGSTGLSVRQTILGFDARGPHLLGASSFADLRVDFNGNPQPGNANLVYYYTNPTLLRLRTAHATLQWKNTDAFFALDRPLFSPDTPSSLTATAEPALAWSGNLWSWNPQFGARQNLRFGASHDLRFEAALMDVADAPIVPAVNLNNATTTPVLGPGGEQSRWPAVETHFELLGSESEEGNSHFGAGGYFAPHHNSLGDNYDSWAGTLDGRVLLPGHLQLTANAYRGLALGGLGGGAYKDFAYKVNPAAGYYFRPLDDVGGWAELKEKVNQRIEFNGAYGTDSVFANQLRRYAATSGNAYLNLAANRTFTGNVIFSPSAYLLLSLEYRHIESSPVVGVPAVSNIVGVAAGYKF